MIQEVARPTPAAERGAAEPEAAGDDPSAFVRGVAVAFALSLPIWGAVIWAFSRVA